MSVGVRLRIGLFLGALLLPLLQSLRPFLPAPIIAGVEEAAPRPPLRWSTWWSGAFQEAFERWFAQGFGLRSYLVRTDNQLNLTLFGTVRTGGTPILRGRENWLFEKSYVDKYNSAERLGPRALGHTIADLQRLNDLLAARGIALVTVIAPSKAEIYPDYLRPEQVVPGRERRQSIYDQLAPALARSGLDLVDGHRLFREARTSRPALLFPRGGTHWNHYGAALAAERILEALDRRRPGRFVTTEVRDSRVDESIWTTDADLAWLLNVWYWRPFVGPQTHPVLARREEGRRPARLLFVGDSFSLPLMNLMTQERLMDPGDGLFYFQRRLHYPGQISSPLDRKAFDAERELRGLDAVVLVTNEYWLPQIGFGFAAAVIASLEKAAAESPLPPFLQREELPEARPPLLITPPFPPVPLPGN